MIQSLSDSFCNRGDTYQKMAQHAKEALTGLDTIVLKNQVIASEGVLPYQDGAKLKEWDNLKQFAGRLIPIIDEHPNMDNGMGGLLSGKEKIWGFAEVKADEATRSLTADVFLEDKAPIKRGYSIGYPFIDISQTGFHGSQKFDSKQKLLDVNHLALTNFPRNQIALRSAGDNSIMGVSDSSQIDKYYLGYDIFKQFDTGEHTIMSDDPKTELDSMRGLLAKAQQEIADLKAQKNALDTASKEVKQALDAKTAADQVIAQLKAENDGLKTRLEKDLTMVVKTNMDSLISRYPSIELKEFDGKTKEFVEGAKWLSDKLIASDSTKMKQSITGMQDSTDKSASPKKYVYGADSINNYRFNHVSGKMEKVNE